MKIAVWCASELGADPAFAEAARALGAAIATRGHELVYGGSQGGLMGCVADACLAAGGKVTGVTVNVPRIVARRHPGLTCVELTPDLITRKARMIDLADAFVALPDGTRLTRARAHACTEPNPANACAGAEIASSLAGQVLSQLESRGAREVLTLAKAMVEGGEAHE